MKKITAVLIITLFCFNAFSQDWPDWRGENRDAIWNEKGVVERFPAPEMTPEWRVSVGPGYTGPTVAKGKVYMMDRQEDPEQKERVLCFDAETGNPIWKHSYNCVYSGIGYQAGPRSSVVINDGKAYSLGSMGHLYCFDAETGKVIWKKVLNEEYKIDMPIWGIASTPLIVDEKIIVHASVADNACVMAFNKNTGEEIWKNLNDRAGYSAPVLIEKNGTRVVVNWTEHSLSGLNPETGEIYWRFPWETGSGMSISTPVLYEGHIFVSAFYSGSLLVKLADDYKSAEKVWQREGENERKTDALHCVMNTPVIIGDYIYGVDSYGELRCLELATGDRIWEDQTAVDRGRWANIHFIQKEEKTWMFNEHGELLITELSPDGFHEISRTKII
ncbi:MAG: PQQ-binding-like beta-propeller repeat protein, partial [Tangfeifania sp.]